MQLKSFNVCPAVSENIVKKITNALCKLAQPKIFMEWGSGGSTLFYLDFFIRNNIACSFLSVECELSWHRKVIEKIHDKYDGLLAQEIYSYQNWSEAKCRKYLKAREQKLLCDIPDLIRKLSVGKNRLKEAILKENGSFLKDGYYSVYVNNLINFKYILKAECFKDQYGESPLKDEYVNSGIFEIESFLNENPKSSLAIVIDGGPRLDILKALLAVEKKYTQANLFICLHDGARHFYQEVLSEYPEGYFVKGSGYKVGGSPTFSKQQYIDPQIEENKVWYGQKAPKIKTLLDKEGWFYEKTGNT